jgi:hypothetical protein
VKKSWVGFFDHSLPVATNATSHEAVWFYWLMKDEE